MTSKRHYLDRHIKTKQKKTITFAKSQTYHPQI